MRAILTLAAFACFSLAVVDAADDCGYFGWRCGDTCIKLDAPCICGDTEIRSNDPEDGSQNLKYCCTEKACILRGNQLTTRTKFTLEVTRDDHLGANCTHGKVLDLWRACNLNSTLQPACNHYPDSEEAPTPRSFVPCVPKVPGQKVTKCIDKAFEGDKVFHCLNRGDENPFLRPNKTNVLDLSILLTKCFNDYYQSAGLTCPTFEDFVGEINCLTISQWCNEASSYTCGAGNKTWGADLKGIKSTDPRICGNFKFWENQGCAIGVKEKQHRCTGNYPGQCVYNDVGKKRESCKDKSDTNPPAPDTGKKCPKKDQIRCLSKMKFWDIRRTEENSHVTDKNLPDYDVWRRSEQYAKMFPCGVPPKDPEESGSGSGSGSEDEYPDGSGNQSGADPEESGSGSGSGDYYSGSGSGDYCIDLPLPLPLFKHKFICIEEASMCDGTPQCEYGEDEDEEMCAKRKKELQDATKNFPCPFPTYIIPKGIKINESDEERFLDVSTTDAIRAKVKLSNESTFWQLTAMYAVRCDGEPECVGGEDEIDCLIIKETLKYAVPLVLVLLIILTLSSSGILNKVFGKGTAVEAHNSNKAENNFKLKILTGDDKLKIKSIIDVETLPEAVLMLQHLELPREVRRKHNKVFFECLEETKGGKRLAKIWMKQNIKHSVCSQILADYEFSGTSMQTLSDLVEDKVKAVKDYLKTVWAKVNETYFWINPSLVKQVVAVWSVYGALVKDSLVLASFFYLLNDRLWDKSFPSTLAWLLFVSIVIPLLFCALETAYYRPLVIFGCSSWQRRMASQPSRMQVRLIQAFIVLFALFLPAILASAIQKARDRKEKLLEKSKKQFLASDDGSTLNNLDVKLRSINQYLIETNLAMLAFRKQALSIENSIQLAIQVLMLMLSPQFTESPTHSGLQAVFKQSFEEKVETFGEKAEKIGLTLDDPEVGGDLATFLLAFSIVWSTKDSVFLYLKVKFIEKRGFLPTKAKVGLAIRSLLAISSRLFCIVFGFFGPFLGLLNILAHWTAEMEKTGFFDNEVPLVFKYKEANTEKIISFSDIFRENRTMGADGYTAYTGIRLGPAFGIFFGLILLQMLTMFFLKKKLSLRFRAANWQTKVQHILESVNRPDYFVDWERGGGSVAEHEVRRKKVVAETSAMVGVHFLFNLFLLVPLWITSMMLFDFSIAIYFLILAKNVRERHLKIKPVIGVFPEETAAFELITFLSWISPCLLTIFSLLELVMVYVYQKYLHPWACIFAEEDLTNTHPNGQGYYGNEVVEEGVFKMFPSNSPLAEDPTHAVRGVKAVMLQGNDMKNTQASEETELSSYSA